MDRPRIIAAVGLLGLTAPLIALRRADAQRAHPIAAARATSAARPPDAAPPRRPAAPVPVPDAVPGFDPSRATAGADGRFSVELPNHARAWLTLEPAWQRATVALLDHHEVPQASVVVLDTDTGRVRVWASRGGHGEDLARAAEPPAASVFKVVTASALFDAGLSEQARTCWSGGFHVLTARDLVSDPRRDRECNTLGEAFAHSINAVFARRALELLSPDREDAMARQWGFGGPIPFDAEVSPSAASVPTDTLPFARTVAGFTNTHLSPLHGALLAQGIARGGEMTRPWIIERVTDAASQVTHVGAPRPWRRAVTADVAAALTRASLRTVSEGTAFHGFHDESGRAYLDGVTVGGKTGTLNGTEPFRAYTWFVGSAEGAGQRLSFAVLVANGPMWRVKAPTLARQVLQIALRGRATDVGPATAPARRAP